MNWPVGNLSLKTAIVVLGLLISVNAPAFAQTISLLNGDFESGDLTGWTSNGVNGGTASIVRRGTCFSYNNTQGLSLGGEFALNVRSSPSASTDSVGVVTSDPFVAGSSVTFNALSEADDGKKTPSFITPVTFEVRLLDMSNNILLSQVLSTDVATLNSSSESCGGEPRNAPFSSHSLDTSSYTAQLVRLQFRQHTNVPEWGFFTLVDDVRLSPPNPALSISLNGCITCEEGGRLTVQARLINPRSYPVRVEVKAGGRLPDGTPVDLFGQQHMELTLEPYLDKTFTLLDKPLPAGIPPGTWTVEGTLLELELGKMLSHDAKTFEIRR
jgi:hypothetical protein